MLACACSTSSTRPHLPALPFDETGASAVVQLDRVPGAFVLPTSSLGEEPIPDRFVFDRFEASDGGPPRFDSRWSAPLPFQPDADLSRFASSGMTVTYRGVPVPYITGANKPDDGIAWRIHKGRLHLAHPRRPEAGEVVLAYPEVARRIERLQLGASDLEPEAFAHYELSLDDDTRTGLLLPAPASATFTVDVPPNAALDAALALAPVPLGVLPPSSGAQITLTVVADGHRTELSRRALSGASTGWEPWHVDLARWGGRQVSLELATDPGANPLHDYVVVAHPAISAPPTSHAVRRVVVIGLDTARPDHLGTHGYGRATSPNLDAFAAHAAVFDQAWAPAPRTRPSFRTVTTGRGPLDAVGATTFGEVFRAHGFATGGVVANVHLNPRFGFHHGFDTWELLDSPRATVQVDRALAWLRDHQDRDSFLFVHLMDPHLFYNAPEPWGSRFVTDPDPRLPPAFVRWNVLEWSERGRLDPRRKAHIEALYDGEIAFLDEELGRLLRGIDALGGNDLVVVLSDHGEEFWEHGGFEHNHSLYDELTRAILWVRPPGGLPQQRRLQVPATLADVAPTLFDFASLSDRPATDGRSLRPWVEGAEPDWPDRGLPLGHLMFDVEQWGVVFAGHKYVVRTASGQESLFDLATDPHEHTDLAATSDLAPYRVALAEAHHMPVGPGWRLELGEAELPRFEIDLPARAASAGVIDPEAAQTGRANQAWGEVPQVLPVQVAQVELADDGRRLVVQPGDQIGTVQVRFEAPTPLGGTMRVGGASRALSAGADGAAYVRAGDGFVTFRTGVVLEPPAGEAARMRALGSLESGSDSDLGELQRIGYLHDDDDGASP